MRRSPGILIACERALLALAMVCLAAPAWAVSLIRDAETETLIRQIADPIFTAARLDPESIDIYVLNDPKLNAFVAGGQNLFINTGLILSAERPDELAGVIAHETGHIAGGHLSRTMQAQQQAGIPMIAGLLLDERDTIAGQRVRAEELAAVGVDVQVLVLEHAEEVEHALRRHLCRREIGNACLVRRFLLDTAELQKSALPDSGTP